MLGKIPGTIYKNYESNLNTLLHKSKGVTIHVRNLQYLMVEVFKSIHNASPIFMSDIFKPAALPYNLRVKDKLIIPKVKTVSNGYQSISFRAAIIWNQLPNKYKIATSVKQFKTIIKNWDGEGCNCRVCVK